MHPSVLTCNSANSVYARMCNIHHLCEKCLKTNVFYNIKLKGSVGTKYILIIIAHNSCSLVYH